MDTNNNPMYQKISIMYFVLKEMHEGSINNKMAYQKYMGRGITLIIDNV